MGVDADLTSIIREIVQFLESLCDVNLPSKLENARTNLLQRSKTKLSSMTTSARGSASPEPYLDMNAGKGFLLFPRRKNRDAEIEEYVGVEEQLEPPEVPSHQDYYETFQEINSNGNEKENEADETRGKNKSSEKLQSEEDIVEEKLRDIYRTFTAAKTINKAYKSGALYQKIERKPFGFVRGNTRLCWIGLVGSHLLVHGSEDDKQAPEVCSIRGYSARPAPSSVSRDPERSKSAFEIVCPGNKTLQFIAKSPEEMEEWLKAINQTCAKRRDGKHDSEDKIEEEKAENCAMIEEKYQDVGAIISPPKIKDSPTSSGGNVEHEKIETGRNSLVLTAIPPPTLPVRATPRRLPSLPNEETPAAPYEPLDNAYEEDDIYHKIEDFCEHGQSYENVKKSKGAKKFIRKRKRKQKTQSETYDDVESKRSSKKCEENGETYDDVSSTMKQPNKSDLRDSVAKSSRKNLFANAENRRSREDENSESYDDVFQSSASLKASFSGEKLKSVESKKPKSEQSVTEKKSSRIEKSSAKSLKSVGRVEKTCQKSDKTPDKGLTKSPSKRSFLDRVRNRKDSPKKDDKKKENASEPKVEKISSEMKKPSEPRMVQNESADLPMYDDVSELVTDTTYSPNGNARSSRLSIHVDEASTYNCPPPPRPIYSRPPSPVLVQAVKNIDNSSEIYDDIENYREKNEKATVLPSGIENFGAESIADEKTERRASGTEKLKKIEINCSNIYSIEEIPRASIVERNKNEMPFDCEHYQIPRGDSLQVHFIPQPDEQLYDDIAIADFRTKQNDQIATSASQNHFAATTAPERPPISTKKSWNRFGSVKKISSRENTLPQSSTTKNKSSLDLDYCPPDHVLPVTDKPETAKLNKLQKLINKMETTLGKQSSTKSSAALSKTNE
ncbi:uncharacterized protein [Venturia canescens]|uniref:uncharacterized protein n=1 Tax=Venturia canescens TaxID=32260 RepID=UPI001C9C170A|nr:uncharacterized protein LOC122417480 [Venturia canescens]XP_043286939.1 uncharacterized protein LOC122417480 [Venturia canescens]XP_043286940.1 uncharacterized protein LOC122417480 [Venturia canescens]